MRSLTQEENETVEHYNGRVRWEQVRQYKERIINGDTIALIWSVDDVDEVAPDVLRPDEAPMTTQEKRRTLALVDDNHDANEGVSWYTLKDAAEDVLHDRANRCAA